MTSSDHLCPDVGALKAKADHLVDVAYLFAIGASHPLLDRLGSLPLGLAVKKRGLERWNVLVVVACAYVALNVLDGDIPSADFEAIAALPFRARPLNASDPHVKPASTSAQDGSFRSLWASEGESAMKQCASFVQGAFPGVPPSSSKEALATAIGSWVISSMYGKAPSSADRALAVALGTLIASSFAPYWTERAHGV